MNSFNRIGEIVIGKPGQQGLVISNLNFAFNVKKTITPEMNPGSLMIYNLSRTQSAAIHELESVCIIKAGYSEGDGASELFRGYVSKVTGMRSGASYVTTLEVRDGFKELQTKKFAKSYAKSTNLQTIVDDIVASLGLPKALKNRLANVAKTKLKRGISFNGYSKDVLNDIAKLAGIEWSVQSGKIKVLEEGKSDQTRSIYLSKETGLLGSPERVSDIVIKKGAAGKDKKQVGWKVSAVLLPKVEPGNSLRISSERVQGDFKVITVQHTGEIMGDEFSTTLEVVEL